MQRNATNLRPAFTLIELLVVIAIIAVLMGLLMPTVQRVREAAASLQCKNNLKQIGVGLHNYNDTHLALPSGYVATASWTDGATDTASGWGWAAQLLPYLEQDALYRRINFNQSIASSPAAAVLVTLYLCPSDPTPPAAFSVPDPFGSPIASAAPSSYAACCGGDESDTTGASGLGIFYRNSRTRLLEVSDGTSNTLLVGDRAWSNANGVWAGAISGGVILRGRLNPCPGSVSASYPAATLVLAHSHLNNATTDTDAGLDDFSSRHIGGSNFVFADGSVHFIRSIPGDNADGTYTPDSLAFQALGTRANGDSIQGLDY
jgi:prepilin-type N-terminal cleavage/methylation domain-containing protein/prepilin-type processing-associated H-X9-DG protein